MSTPTTARSVAANRGIEAKYRKALQRLIAEMHGSVEYWLTAGYRQNPPRVAALVEQESCASRAACWNPGARLKTSREEGAGMGQRSPHYLTVGLCPEHHRGSSGVHGLGVRGFYTRYKLDELDLLSMTIQGLMEVDHA